MDAFYSTTLDHMHKNGMIEDNVFMTTPLYAWLKSKGRVEPFTGGAKIDVKLMHGANTTVGSVGEYEEIDLSPQNGITTAYYDTAEYTGAVTLSNKEMAANRGKERAVNLITAKTKQTALSFGEVMSQHLWDPRTAALLLAGTTGNGGKNIYGLPFLAHWNVAAAGSLIAGLDAFTNTDHAFFANQYQDYGATNTKANFADSLSKLYVNITAKGPGGQPDGGFCDLTTFTKYVGAMEAYKRYDSSDESMASLGFENVKYLKCAIMPDPYASDPEAFEAYDNTPTAGVLYMLHSDFCCLKQRAGRDFTPGPFQRAPKQLAKSSILEWEGQLVTNNRRKLGVMYGVTKAIFTA